MTTFAEADRVVLAKNAGGVEVEGTVMLVHPPTHDSHHEVVWVSWDGIPGLQPPSERPAPHRAKDLKLARDGRVDLRGLTASQAYYNGLADQSVPEAIAKRVDDLEKALASAVADTRAAAVLELAAKLTDQEAESLYSVAEKLGYMTMEEDVT